jgi:hypothetical protein
MTGKKEGVAMSRTDKGSRVMAASAADHAAGLASSLAKLAAYVEQ